MKTQRIFSVEDDEIMGSLLTAVLKRSGCTASFVRWARTVPGQITKPSYVAIIHHHGLRDEDGLARKV